MKLSPRTIVFVAPKRIRKDFFEVLINEVPKTAAWPEPRPGRKEVKGAVSIEAISGGKNSFFVIFIFLIDCFVILVFDFMLMIRDDAPNRPESSGRNGSFIGELRTAIPRNPERKKTTIAISFSVSFEIRKIVLAISK